MKKAILTFGLFSMIMVLTSFTTPGEIGGNSTPKTDPGLGGRSPMTYDIGGSTAPKTDPKGLGFADIGGSTTPKTDPKGLGGFTDIGGSTAPKTDPKGLGIAI